MKHMKDMPKKRLLTTALLLAIAPPMAMAQDAASAPAQPAAADQAPADPATLDTVVVTGIRASLTSSMNLKRDAQGVVDGIVAEDIGKFPDTNLAEALQRISGVSIDRNNGEGSRVTVRGIGPDFNLVLLNGRQMPTVTGGRAFDFGNIAAEAVSAVEVYKTSRADIPTGGLGATINVKTARPLDNPGMSANVGVKGVWDTSDDDMPGDIRGDTVTPEMFGIFSTTSADGRFGVAVNASYQERDSGSATAGVAFGNGWRPFLDSAVGDERGTGSSLPTEGQPGYENVTNRPGPNDVYSMPQSLAYGIDRVQRKRTNGQVVFQWAPTDDLTTTLDYTYAENKVRTQRNDMSVWQNMTPDRSSWTSGPGSSPLDYHETYGLTDFSNGAADFATAYEGESVGLNVAWDARDNLSLALDYHHSTATNEPDSPYGSSNTLATLGMFRVGNTLDFSGDFPILNIELVPGLDQIDPSKMMVAGSVFGASYQRAEIDQLQASGEFRFENYSKLNFGVASTDYKNHSASTNVQLDTWGGATSPDDYPDEVWPLAHMGDFFKSFSGHNDPNFSDEFFLFDFNTVRELAAKAWEAQGRGIAADYLPSFDYSFDGTKVPGSTANRSVSDSRVREKSKSIYLQWSNSFDWRLPVDIAAGVRWEKTEVEASALQSAPSGVDWVSENEFIIRYDGSEYRELGGDYDYFLPNLNIAIDLTGDMKLRLNYGETIGRPNWGDLSPALGVGGQMRYDGGSGGAGNPALLPLESRNIDLSYEWYYSEASYLSVGYFHKKIDNFIASATTSQTPYPDLHTPAGGAYWDAAVNQGGCAATDRPCIRDYIFANFDGQPGVDSTAGNMGTISGLPADPLATFQISQPVNNRSDTLDGWEFNIQHVFAETGFGLAANYTLVDSGLTYDNNSLDTQFAMTGLSDSANFVAFYDKGPWQVRAAYNWRDKFLSGLGDGKGSNPIYVEAYGQLDMNVSYDVNEHLSLSLEGINLTDETTRVHGRNSRQLYQITQLGPRYMFGLRYRF